MSKKFLVDILAKAGLVVEGTTDLQGTATAITQSSSDNSTKLATTAFVKNQGYAADNLMVHLAGTETITGVKTFSPTVTASAGLGRSVFVDGTITASANNNTLVGLDIAPVFDASTFTGVNSYAVRISGTYANTYPSYIKFVNNGIGAQTGAAIEFPFGQRIVASSLSPLQGGVGFTFFDKVSTTDGVGLNSSLLQFSSTTPSIKGSGSNGTLTIAQENGTSSFILLKSGGSIGFQTYISAAYTDVVRIFRLTGNVLLQNGGTFTDAGYRLDVNGTVRLQGETRLTTLAGTGDRMVVANSSGVLSTQAIPSVTGFVPYTGATTNVDLGANNLTAAGLTASSLSISVATSTVPVTITNVNGSNGGTLVLNNTSTFGSGLVINKTGAGYGLEVNGYSKFTTGLVSDGEIKIADNRLYIASYTGSYLDVYARVEFAGAYTDYRPASIVMYDKQSTYSKTLILKQGILTSNHNILFPDASGTVALVSDIPSLTGYVPTSRTITINGTSYDLSANRSWSISGNINARTETEFTTNGSTATYSVTYTVGQVDVFYNGSKLSATEFTATDGTSVTLGFTPPSGQLVEVVAWETGGGVSSGRTLTINGTAYDLSANRSWTVTDSSKLPLSGGTLTGALNGTSATFSSDVIATGHFVSNTGDGYYTTLNGNHGMMVYGATGLVALMSGGNETMILNSSGRVGIGTSSPLYNLHVAKSTSENSFIGVGQGSANGDRQLRIGFGGNGSHTYASIQGTRYNTADDVNIVMQSGGGNVGIGTSSPNRLLTLKVSSDGVNGISFQSYASTSEVGYIKYEQTNDILDIYNVSGYSGSAIRFSTAGTERMRITSGGNLLVGQTSDNGSRIAATANMSGWGYRYFNSWSSSVEVYVSHGGGYGIAVDSASNSSGIYLLKLAGGDGTNRGTNVRFQVNANGNVGIGTDSPISGGSAASWLTLNGTTASSYTGGIVYAYNGSARAYHYYDAGLYHQSAAAQFFVNDGSERMRVTSAGNVCIGGTDPLSNAALTLFAVNGSTTSLLSIKANNASGSNASIYLEAPGVVGGGMYLDRNTSTLRVWQAGSTNGVQLTNNATSWGSFSDERLKTDLVSIDNAIDKITNIRAVTGRYKTDNAGTSRSFLIAQDVQKVFPEAVEALTDEIGTLSLRYTDIIPVLVKAIQEQQAQIEELKARLN